MSWHTQASLGDLAISSLQASWLPKPFLYCTLPLLALIFHFISTTTALHLDRESSGLGRQPSLSPCHLRHLPHPTFIPGAWCACVFWDLCVPWFSLCSAEDLLYFFASARRYGHDEIASPHPPPWLCRASLHSSPAPLLLQCATRPHGAKGFLSSSSCMSCCPAPETEWWHASMPSLQCLHSSSCSQSSLLPLPAVSCGGSNLDKSVDCEAPRTVHFIASVVVCTSLAPVR